MMESNIIRPSSSPFASPMLLVKKKDGSDKLCIDFRELNANTVSDKYPLPLISYQINRLRGSKYFSSLDMASGFYQIPIHTDSIEKTAFVTPEGQYEFLAMSFGLKNASSVFQRAIVQALVDLAYSYAIVYIDDVLIVANSKEEAFTRLKVVLKALSDAGFSFNIKKCTFFKTGIEYLGFYIKEGEIKPHPRKKEALSALSQPTTATQLRQFIGLASYFRQFVPRFSEQMKPLYQLSGTVQGFVWKQNHEEIRKKIIDVLTIFTLSFRSNCIQTPAQMATMQCSFTELTANVV